MKMKNKKMIALVIAIIAVVALFTGVLVACNNKALVDITSADSSGYTVANYGKGYSLYNKKNKQVIDEFYDYMEIAEEGYLLASNENDKGISLLDYTGKILISGVNSDYQSYDFEMNTETTVENSDTFNKKKTSIKNSIAYITVTDSKGIETICSPSGKEIVKLEDTDEQEIYFEPNFLINEVNNNTTTTTSHLLGSTAIEIVNYIENSETSYKDEEIVYNIYDNNFKIIYSRTAEFMNADVIDNGVNYAYLVSYEENNETKLDIVSQDGKVKTYIESQYDNLELSYDYYMLATQKLGASNTEILNLLTGKTITVSGSVLSIDEKGEGYAEIAFSDNSKQIIDMNNMSIKLSTYSRLNKDNAYFYSTTNAVYDANYNEIDDAIGFVKTLCNDNGNIFSLLKKTNDIYYLYKNDKRIAEVPSSIEYNYAAKLISYTDSSNIVQYAHLSAPNRSLFNDNNVPTEGGKIYNYDFNWLVTNNTIYLYNTSNFITFDNNLYHFGNFSNAKVIYNNDFGALYSLELLNTASDSKNQYKLLLVTRNGIKEIASGESQFDINFSSSDDKITISNNEKYFYGDVIIPDNCLDFNLKDYSDTKNIKTITDKYIITENPNTYLNAVYHNGKIILPALYNIKSVKGDYAIYVDRFTRLKGLIKLEKDGYKIVEKAIYTDIIFNDIENDDNELIAFIEMKKGEPSRSLKNMKTNKYVFKNAYSVTPITAVMPNTITIGEKYSLPIAYTEKKGGATKIAWCDVIVDNI